MLKAHRTSKGKGSGGEGNHQLGARRKCYCQQPSQHLCQRDFPGDSVVKNLLYLLDFPGGAVDRNPPAKAGDTGSTPGLGKIPQAAEPLSPCTTTEPTCSRAQELQLSEGCAPQREATAMRNPGTTRKSSPYLPKLEKPHSQQ